MAYFVKNKRYREQARSVLCRVSPGTPVNSPQFVQEGYSLNLMEYGYILREANIPQKVWVVATVYAQEYNWDTRRGVWVNDLHLAKHAKFSPDEFVTARDLAMNMQWVTQSTDPKTRKTAIFPAIGEGTTVSPEEVW
jgi:hypothetical protein